MCEASPCVYNDMLMTNQSQLEILYLRPMYKTKKHGVGIGDQVIVGCYVRFNCNEDR